MKTIRSRIMITVMAAILVLAPMEVFGATKTVNISSGTLEAGKQFSLTGMPYNGKYSPIKTLGSANLTFSSVQNFSYTPDDKYIFTVSECRTGKTKHTLLTRCTVPAAKSADAKAVYTYGHVLKNYGHGEVIAITQDKPGTEVYNLWVASTPSKDGLGINIERLTYKVQGNGGSITKRVIITNFKKANVKSGKASLFDGKPTPRRLNVYIDKDANLITFRVQFPTGQGVDYVGYNFKKLNTQLNKVKNNGKYDISKAAKLQKMHVRTSLVPFGTFQSFTTMNGRLYVCGGHMNKGAQIYEIPFATQKDGKAKIQKKQAKSCIKRIIKIEPRITVEGRVLGLKDLEIEGSKVARNGNKIDFYVNFFMNNTPIGDTIGIYRFSIAK